MQVSLGVSDDVSVIQAYTEFGFTVSRQDWQGPIAVRASRCQTWAGTQALDVSEFAAQAEFLQGCEIVLIGTGAKSQFFAPSKRQILKDLGMITDTMDTGAAARTYNVLLGDGRLVGALLLPNA